MKVSVICPVEEKLSINKGGAIAAWIIEVYSRLDKELDYAVFCPAVDNNASKKVKTGSLFYFNCLDSVVKITSYILAKVLRKNKNFIRSKLLGNGRLWIKLLPREVYESSVIHLHNRPLYAPWLRMCGYRGKIILHMHNNMADYISSKEFTLVNESVDDFWFCSEFLLNRCKSDFPLIIGSSIYNGVSLYDFSYNDETKKESSDCSVRNLVIAGRIVKEKGLLEAIEICDALNEKGHHRYTLSICGSTASGGNNEKTEYSTCVENLANEVNHKYGLPTIIFKGHLDKVNLLRFVSTCDLFIFPCQWDEPFGMVLIESMSVGTPLVASQKGGIPEIISTGVDGILIEDCRKLSNFISAIEYILSNPEEYNYIKGNALKKIDKLFTWEHIVKRMLFLMSKKHL